MKINPWEQTANKTKCLHRQVDPQVLQGRGVFLKPGITALCPFLLYVHWFLLLQFSALRVTGVDTWGAISCIWLVYILLYKGSKKSWCKENYLMGSVQFSCSVVSDSLRPHELQHARPSCPSPSPEVHSDSRPSSQWCHPAISSSVVPFSSCPQSLPASESFPVSQLFAWAFLTFFWPWKPVFSNKI